LWENRDIVSRKEAGNQGMTGIPSISSGWSAAYKAQGGTPPWLVIFNSLFKIGK
jgi:hypothetical protein